MAINFIKIHKFTILFLILSTLLSCQISNNPVGKIEQNLAKATIAPTPSSLPRPLSLPSVAPTVNASGMPSSTPIAPLPFSPVPLPSVSVTPSAALQCIDSTDPFKPRLIACPPEQPTPAPTPTSTDPCYKYIEYPDMGVCPGVVGVIYDQSGKPMSGVKVEFVGNGLTQTLMTGTEGKYIFRGRSGLNHFLQASKAGFASRSFNLRDYKSPIAPNYPDTFNVDFGGDGTDYSHHPELFLDDRPEVEVVGVKSTSNKFSPEFPLRFSEPVDTGDIEKKFHLVARSSPYLLVEQPSFYSNKLQETILLFNIWEPGLSVSETQIVFGPQNFNFNWNVAHSEVSITFKPGHQLVTNKSPEGNSFHYGLAFVDPENKDRGIRDLAGNVRSEKHFVYNNPTQASDFYKYIALQDEIPPKLLSLQALDSSLRLNFSKIMAIQTYKYLIAGGMIDMLPPSLPGSETRSPAEYPGNLGNVTGRKTAANYKLKMTRGGSEVLNTTWKALGGEARYDNDDPSRQSVRLHSPRSNQAVNGFHPNYTWVNTAAIPAGFGQGSSPEQTWVLHWQGVRRDGSLGPQRMATLAGHVLRSSPEWATQLQLALQANSPEEGNWQVQASADGSQLKLRLESSDGEYLGWKPVGIETPSAAFPSSLATVTQNWSANSDWRWWQGGDTLSIEVINPIFDPAGNAIDPAGKSAMMTVN